MSESRGPNLDARIWAIIDGFDSELEDEWDDPEEGRRTMELARLFARFAVGITDSLVVDSGSDLGRHLPEILQALDLEREVREATQVAIAFEYCTGTRRMAERCVSLSRFVIEAAPRPQVLRFLKRVTRCYVVGFSPECVIVCRAVLESALRDTFDRKDIPLPAPSGTKSHMRGWLDAAVMFRWLTPVGRDHAWEVWVRGNKAVHDDPHVTDHVLETIGYTMETLEQLYAA